MPKLSVLDMAMFLLETPKAPFNVGPLILLRPPKGARNFADRLLQRMLEHPPGAPFNYRLNLSLKQTPSVDPVENPDVSAQVHRLTLAGNGSMEALIDKICKLHETPLDRRGLLWQLYVIDGLDGGRVAIYAKVHHGIIDGRGFVNVMTHWFSADPDDTEVRALWQGVPRQSHVRARLSEGLHGAPRDLVETVRGLLQKSTGLLGAVAALYRMLAAQGQRSLGLGGEAMDLPFVGVPRVFSGAASAKRNYAYMTLPLAELKSLGRQEGATINDMLLAVLDGALTRYLDEYAESARKPLVVDMPLALEDKGAGNQIAVLQLAMGQPGATARQRLLTVREETARVKMAVKDNSNETVMLYTTLVHALPVLLDRVGVTRPLMLSNLVFSNPFGFSGRSYLMGAEVELALPMSVVAAGQMLNVTAVTLGDRVQIGFLGIPDAIEHIDALARYTTEAFDALKAEISAAAKVRTADKPPRARKAVTKPAVKVVPRKRSSAKKL